MFLGVTGVVNDNIGLFGVGVTIVGNVFGWIIPKFQAKSKPSTSLVDDDQSSFVDDDQ